MARFTVGLVGARGHVGQELVRIVEGHARLSLSFVASRSVAGQRVRDHMPHARTPLTFEDVRPEGIAARKADVYVLALSNGEAAPYVEQINRHHPGAVVVDVSADHRFTDGWTYGLPEHFRDQLRGARRIANPGCYSTAAQLGLWPLLALLEGTPTAFGVSGYSGAGATPNPRNDVDTLRDNVMPYALTGHLHEREISTHLGHSVFFMPHVAPFFRGMVVTLSAVLKEPLPAGALLERFTETYRDAPLISVQKDVPLPRDAVGLHGATVGGFAAEVERRHAVVCVTLDNLLKGAASQAVQNINLALGIDELEGIAA